MKKKNIKQNNFFYRTPLVAVSENVCKERFISCFYLEKLHELILPKPTFLLLTFLMVCSNSRGTGHTDKVIES